MRNGKDSKCQNLTEKSRNIPTECQPHKWSSSEFPKRSAAYYFNSLNCSYAVCTVCWFCKWWRSGFDGPTEKDNHTPVCKDQPQPHHHSLHYSATTFGLWSASDSLFSDVYWLLNCKSLLKLQYFCCFTLKYFILNIKVNGRVGKVERDLILAS